jgi:hypothetical protein
MLGERLPCQHHSLVYVYLRGELSRDRKQNFLNLFQLVVVAVSRTDRPEAGCSADLRKSAGRSRKLDGCEDVLDVFAAQMQQISSEDVLDVFAAQMQQISSAGVSISTYTTRCMLVAAMQEAGKEDMLSPHLTSDNGEVGHSKFLLLASKLPR